MGDGIDDLPPPPPTSEEPGSPPRDNGYEMDVDNVGDPADERKKIKALSTFEVQVGGKYNLIEASWWRTWCEWTCFDEKEYDSEDAADRPIRSKGPRPPQIDNTPLFAMGSKSKLIRPITEHQHYELLTPQAWALLVGWYGGGPAILRRGISESRNSRNATVELHGIIIKVMLSNDKSNMKDMNVSKAGTVRELKETIMNEFNIKGQDVRLWDYFRSAPFALLDVPSSTLGDAQIMDNQEILVEIPDENGVFHIKKPSSGSSYGNDRSGAMLENLVVSNMKPVAPGVCGLSNLGNTCFMNSTLQCLSNTPPLKEYFASNEFKNDINRNNPLGHEGKLAESFGNLIQLMWGSNGQPASAVSPKGFKYQMGRFRPEFQGYQQHDSSELMNFLLDGLHEDLNRIIDKPYTEAVENDGTKPDNEMAQVFLEQHMKRNDSFIHDLFRGQFKSTLVCPCCGNVSVTFDPYTMVSLPLTTLEQERMTSYHVTVWSQAKASDGSKCPGRTKQNIKVSIVKGSKALALMEAVAEATNIDIKRLVFTQVMRGYVYKIFEKAASLDYLNNSSKLYAHEVEEAQPFNFDDYSYLSYGRTPKAESIYSAVTCLFRYQEEESVNYYLTKSTRVIPKLFGEPMLLCHPKETNPKALYAAVARAMSPMVEVDGVQKQLVLPEHINIFVSKDIYASQNKVDSHPVDRLDSQAIDQGMHAKLTLVIEFEQDFIDRVMFNTSKNEVMKIPGIPVHTLRKGGGSSEVEEESKGAAEDDDEEEEDDNTDKTMKIDDCFELFETPEKLSVEDSWYCGKCKDHVQASKTMELWSTPEVLVLHLKRFSYSRWSRDKLETPVSFPLDNLDMSRFMKGPSTGDCIYDCVAVSNHMGSLGGGHYTACARGADNKWYSFNDSHTGEVHASRVNSSNVYLLFYVKRTTLAKTEIANDKQADVVSSGAGGGGAAMLD